MIKNFLKLIWVIQEKKIKTEFDSFERRRLNPYNPLTYITILITLIVAFILFGIIGMWNEIDLRNPFKYQK